MKNEILQTIDVCDLDSMDLDDVAALLIGLEGRHYAVSLLEFHGNQTIICHTFPHGEPSIEDIDKHLNK